MAIIVTNATPDHYSKILELNENAYPSVSIINEVELSTLASQAFYFAVAKSGDDIAGFMITLAPGQGYESPNYLWFSEKYDRFVYIDRIVISPKYIGQGIGALLYKELEELGKTFATVLTCEVNLRPPNPESMAFHKKLGFTEVGQQETNNGENLVCLMAKELG